MCGIVGIVGHSEVAAQLYDGLTVLQHRGQDAAGIATADGGTRLRVHKGNGLVRDVFDAEAMALLEGRVGIAHCRYPTAGSEGSDEAQPFYVNSPFGIALAHNGNLINTDALRREVFEQDRRNVNTESDSEVLLNVFAHELDLQKALTPEAAFRALEGVNAPRQGRLCGGLRGAGPGPGRVPRSERHPPAGAGQARGGRRRRIHRGLRVGGAGHPRLRARARRARRARAS
jgi:amidophosphoribosyltransferase